jgi:glycosyltransferase involved in cell wall biosynthesis
MQPTVSIIVPCFNEEATIGSLLDAIHEQTYPRNRVEVVIADGLSEDGTRTAVAGFRQKHPRLAVRVIDNPKRTIPAGLNLAIRDARGEILVRLDAHSVPIPGYVERCVRDLELGKGSNVGGVWAIAPGRRGWIPEGIAAAAGHPLGAGDALYRLGGQARAVDTVPFGAFRRSLIAEVGEFDEGLLTNEDYEFNVRIRKHGGVVWMDPEIQSTYVARSTLTALARQYWRYGFWKLRMLARYPSSLRWRQALPPLFVLSVSSLALAGIAWRPAVIILACILLIYLIVLTAAGIQLGLSHRKPSLIPGSILAFATMHLGWGAGFWASLLDKGLERNG